MPLNESFLGELQHETKLTRSMLERVPEDKLTWKPHEKSMSLGELSSHIAEIPGWASSIIEEDELDFAKTDYKPVVITSRDQLLKMFDENVTKGIESLKKAGDETLKANWKMRSGEQIFFDMPRTQVIRGFILNHGVHHRGQLSVFLRLNDVPLPSIYGPTADEGNM
ncbi:MAG: DinB family protein [Ignavibacteria bacterium]